MNWTQAILTNASYSILVFYAILYSVYIFLVYASFHSLLVRSRRARLWPSRRRFSAEQVPLVSILVPAYNEEKNIVESVRGLLGLRYPGVEVIVVNDGSDDDTLGELIRSFSMHRADLVHEPQILTCPIEGLFISATDPRLLVVDKSRGGKSDALNAAINLARTPWVCSVDVDSILEEDALFSVMRPALEDERVVASSGMVRVANGSWIVDGRVSQVRLPRRWLEGMQVVEYFRGFLQGRLGWNWLNGLILISGSFSVFRTDVLREIGGYSNQTVTEDMEVVIRIHRHLRFQRRPYRVESVVDSGCWTKVPSSLASLSRQRRRWHRGMAEVLWMHRNLLFNPRMGSVGFFVLPVFAMELISPLVELVAFALVPAAMVLGWISRDIFFFFLALTLLLGILLSICAVLLEEYSYRRYNRWQNLVRLLVYAIFEFPVKHPLTVLWRLQGLYDYLHRQRGWGRR